MSTSIHKTSLLKTVNALRELQIETAEIEEKLLLEVIKLEEKYDCQLQPFLERRRQIIMGEYEPGEEESDTSLTYVEVPSTEDVDIQNLKGIPDFWFTVLNNIPIFWSLIQCHDCDPLKYLTDVASVKTTHPEPGFTLQFHFAPNQYFTNEILTKQYILEFGKKKNDPFNKYVPEMIDCIGCDIDWKSQDLTVTIRKNKIIKRASFFNFFDPPKNTNDPKLEPYFLSYTLTDFYLGSYLKERVIPKAVLYYLGEAVLRENFGFEEDITQKKDVDLIKNWPTTYRRQFVRNEQCEKDLKVWEKSEKVLAERLTKQKFEKAGDFEESKVNLTNLFLLGENAKEDQTKYLKSKFTEKLLVDLVFSRKEIVAFLSKGKKRKPTIKNSQKINDKNITQPGMRNASTVKRRRTKTKRGIGTINRSVDHATEQFIDLQKDLLLYYNERAKHKDNSPKTEEKVEEPKVESIIRTIHSSELGLDLETLVESYDKESTKNKLKKKNKVKRSQR